MPSFPETVGTWLLDLLGFVGLALGGSQAAATSAIDQLQQDSWHQNPLKRLSAEQLAGLVVRGVIPQTEGASEATYDGIRADRFDAMVQGTGNPPGPAELLTMWRRRINSDDDVRTGLKQGDLKNEWIDHVMALRHDPLPLGEAVAAAVQNHLPYDDAATFADMYGIDRATFDVMFANAGNPPGPLQLLNLWVRGYIDEATVDQGLRESRLKDKWIEPLKKLAIRKVPLRSITQLLNAGAIDDATATRMLSELGYSPDDVRALLAAHKKAGTAGAKTVSAATIENLYAQKLITRDVATAELVAHGYTDVDAGVLLDYADSRWRVSLQAQVIGRVRAALLAHKIDAAKASTELDRIMVPGDHRDALLTAWAVEMETALALLSVAQLLLADKKGVLAEATVHGELLARGYSERDATVLQVLHGSLPYPDQPII